MPTSIITPTFTDFLIDDIQNHFTEEANTYVTLGRLNGTGANNANVEDIIFTTVNRNSFYRNMVGIKKVTAADMQPVIPRIDWSANTVYDEYQDHVDIFGYTDYYNIGTGNANTDTILIGTANISASNVVVGNGTSFNTYIFPGDQIVINSATKLVVSVTNTDHLIVNSAFANTNTGSTITLKGNARTLIGNSANFFGSLESGNVVSVGDDSREIVALLSNKVAVLNTNLTISVANTTISRKDNTYPYLANTFYVRNSRDQVFKCIFNNSDANSSIEPIIDIDGQLPENAFILTADGYKWKYLYTIPAGLKQKFFTNRWMPVSNDSVVVEAATDGRIDVIKVLWGGSGYLNGGNSNTARILDVTNTDGAGANLAVSVANGVITSITILNGGNNYTIGTVEPNSSADQKGFAIIGGTVNINSTLINANIANTANQSFTGNVLVNDIVTVNSESRNVVTVVSGTQLIVNTPFSNSATDGVLQVSRSNAVFDIQFGPPGGHGSNPFAELRTHSFMISVPFEGTENETIPMSDSTNLFDFNQVGILLDPLVGNGAFTANQTNYRMTTRLEVSDPGLNNFIDDESVYVGTSLNDATAVANVAHWDPGDNYLYINNITGTFVGRDTIKGATSGASVPILGISNSEIKLYSGQLLYMENRTNVTRKDAQIDQVKIVLSF